MVLRVPGAVAAVPVGRGGALHGVNGRPLGPAAEVGSPGLHLGGGGRHRAVGGFHPCRQLVDTAPAWLKINPARGRVELTSLLDVFFNSTNLIAVRHVLTAAFLTAAAEVIGVRVGRSFERSPTEWACWTWVQFLYHGVWIKGRPGEFGLRGRRASSGQEFPRSQGGLGEVLGVAGVQPDLSIATRLAMARASSYFHSQP
jgi:hypothetical protein